MEICIFYVLIKKFILPSRKSIIFIANIGTPPPPLTHALFTYYFIIMPWCLPKPILAFMCVGGGGGRQLIKI